MIPHGVMPIENEIAQRQEAAKKAALPKNPTGMMLFFSGTLPRRSIAAENRIPKIRLPDKPDHLPSIHLYHQKRKRTQHGHFSAIASNSHPSQEGGFSVELCSN